MRSNFRKKEESSRGTCVTFLLFLICELDSEFSFYSETWRSLLGLNISFNFYFVSKLSTNKGLFLIWINISELRAVPDVDQEHLPGEFGKFETEKI